jgi:NADH dehydrogenase FAD-containing subunit
MSDNDKRLRYDVLLTAIGMVDTNYFQLKDSGEKNVPVPSTQDYITKAEDLLKFIEGDGLSTSTKQLLNETDTTVGC